MIIRYFGYRVIFPQYFLSRKGKQIIHININNKLIHFSELNVIF